MELPEKRSGMKNPGRLVALDPGDATGWAFFEEGLLVAAGCSKPDDICDDVPRGALRADIVVIELPQNWPGKTPITSIITLAVRVGTFKERWERYGASVELVWPTTWKGSVPKKIHNDRVLEALSAAERKLLPKRPRAKDFDHNMLDAVGIGLWKLGRM